MSVESDITSMLDTSPKRINELEEVEAKRVKREAKAIERDLFSFGQVVEISKNDLFRIKGDIQKARRASANYNLFLHEEGLILAGHEILRNIIWNVMEASDFDVKELRSEWVRVYSIYKEVEKKVEGEAIQ